MFDFRTFPWIIEVFDISPFYFYKVIEILIRAEDSLSRDVVKHLNHVSRIGVFLFFLEFIFTHSCYLFMFKLCYCCLINKFLLSPQQIFPSYESVEVSLGWVIAGPNFIRFIISLSFWCLAQLHFYTYK